MGERIGSYEILGELGRGGAGVVFVARDAAGRKVALKRTLGERPEQWARAVREGEALARLEHPNVVRVFGAGSDAQGPYLALELVEGRSLEERLEQEGPLPPEEARALAEKLAGALAAVHAQGLVHRDVKPSNVLLRAADGEPLLTDFGLVRGLDGASLTRTGSLVGTPSYWSPEQATGQRDVDARTDIYSLGATLYAALTGRPPFLPQSLLEAVRMTTEVTPDRPSRHRSLVPWRLGTVCLRCLEKRPEDRYPTAAALADALRAAAGAGPSGRVVAAGAIVLGLLALGGLFGLALARTPEAPAPTAVPAPSPPRTVGVAPVADQEARALLRAFGQGRPEAPALQRWWGLHVELVKRVDRLKRDVIQLDPSLSSEALVGLGGRVIEEARALRAQDRDGAAPLAAAWQTQLTLGRAAVVLSITRPNGSSPLAPLVRRSEALATRGPGADAHVVLRGWHAIQSKESPLAVASSLPRRAPEAPLWRFLHYYVQAYAVQVPRGGDLWPPVFEALQELPPGPVAEELERRARSRHAAVLLALARVQMTRGKPVDTTSMVLSARRALELESPRRASTMNRLAVAQILAGRFEAARLTAASAARQFRTNTDAIAILGRCDEEQGRLERARKRIERALLIARGNAALNAALARVRLLEGDPRWSRSLPLDRTIDYMPWLHRKVLQRLAAARAAKDR